MRHCTQVSARVRSASVWIKYSSSKTIYIQPVLDVTCIINTELLLYANTMNQLDQYLAFNHDLYDFYMYCKTTHALQRKLCKLSIDTMHV